MSKYYFVNFKFRDDKHRNEVHTIFDKGKEYGLKFLLLNRVKSIKDFVYENFNSTYI